MSAQDEADFEPRLEVTVTFPQGLTQEQMVDGRGMAVTAVGSYMSNEVVITSLLRTVEALMMDGMVEMLNENRGPLAAPLPEDAERSLVLLNARLGVATMMLEMSPTSSVTAGFSIG